MKAKVLNLKIYLYDYEEDTNLSDEAIQEIIKATTNSEIGGYCISDYEVVEEEINI
jgi:hypothetical protein